MKATIVAVVALVLFPGAARAWEAKVFEGEPVDAVQADLFPHRSDSDGTFYSEDYSFTLRLDGKMGLNLKFGMSNLLGGKGSAFIDASVRAPGMKRHKLRKTYAAGEWSFEEEPFALKLKDLTFSGDPTTLNVAYETSGARVSLQLVAMVPGMRPGSGRATITGEGYVGIVVWPRMTVTGTIYDKVKKKEHKVTGGAIFSHAASTLPPGHMPPRWYYFRSTTRESSVLFQALTLLEEFGGTTHGWLVVVEGKKVLFRTTAMDLTPTSFKKTKGASLPWALYLKGRGEWKLEGAIKATKLKRAVNRLKKLPKLYANIVRKFVNPTRYTFGAEMELLLPGGKKIRVDGEYKVETMK